MGKVIATINLKGGVAKTTTTVGLGEMLALHFDKKVLVIDLDPQTNATTMLIGEHRWKELNEHDCTLARLFKNAFEPNIKFNLQNMLQRNVSNITAIENLDLIPSSLDLISIQDQLAKMEPGPFFANNPVDILRKTISPIIEEYDYILIDCPPNLGIITLNGLRIADGYIIPTIPDVLSTYGIPQIKNRINDFALEIGRKIELLGIVVTKYRDNSILHKNTLDKLKRESDAPLFSSIFKENIQMATAADHTVSYSTFKQKWGYHGQFESFNTLAREIIERYE